MSHAAKPLSPQEDFLPFAKPCISEEAIQEVVDCLRSGWITTGPRVQQFEVALKSYLQAPHAITVSSATAGLQLALMALNLRPGDEVITTAMTFVASANAIIHAGGTPVLVDVDPRNYNIDLNLVKKAITPKTKVIMPVHYGGYPVDLDALYALAEKHKLRVVEDCAHAIGAEYKGKKLGSFGDIQVFSFHPNKNMTTGEGGCITTRDEKVAQRLQTLRFHGIDREAWNRFAKKGSQIYDVIEPGYKYNMMDMQAALGLHQIKALDGFIDRRIHQANRYLEELSDWGEFQLPAFEGYQHKHAWHLFNPLLTSMDRDDFIEKMKEHNIGIGLHYQSLNTFKYYQESYGYKIGDFPCAEKIGQQIVSLPLFPTMTEGEQARVINTLKKVFGRN